MICDTLHNASHYFVLSRRIEAALKFLMQPGIERFGIGRHEIEPGNVFALIQEYSTKPREQCFWEAHRRYIDVQFIASGTEAIAWAPIETMRVSKPYDSEKDLAVFEGDGQVVNLSAGSFAIFMPHDVHMPCLSIAQPQPVRKIVVKVAVE